MDADEAVIRNSSIAPNLQDIVLIGSGGFGSVFKAYDRLVDRTVAIKVLHSNIMSGDVATSRFLREAQALAKLSHPRIVKIFAYGRTFDGNPYMVMEFIDGVRLSDKVQSDTQLEVSTVQALFIEILDAIEAMHKMGFVHRDLSTANIMITNDGKPKVFDFGFVKFLAGQEALKLTRTRQVCGTVAYCSPEVCMGEPADVRSDIYSLGCVLYYMLTGRPPFLADSVEVCMMQHVKCTAAATYTYRTDSVCYPLLEEILARCLSKEPKDRYQSVAELRLAMEDPATIQCGDRPAESLHKRGLAMPLLITTLVASLLWFAVAVSHRLHSSSETAFNEPSVKLSIATLRKRIKLLNKPPQPATEAPSQDNHTGSLRVNNISPRRGRENTTESSSNVVIPPNLSPEVKQELFADEVLLVKLLLDQKRNPGKDASIQAECLAGLQVAYHCASTEADRKTLLELTGILMKDPVWSQDQVKSISDLWLVCAVPAYGATVSVQILEQSIASYRNLVKSGTNPDITARILAALSELERFLPPGQRKLVPERMEMERKRGTVNDDLAMMLIEQAENEPSTEQAKQYWKDVRGVIEKDPQRSDSQRASILIRYAEANLLNDHSALLKYATRAKQLLANTNVTDERYVHALTLCARAYDGLKMYAEGATEWSAVAAFQKKRGAARLAMESLQFSLHDLVQQRVPSRVLRAVGESTLASIEAGDFPGRNESISSTCTTLMRVEDFSGEYCDRLQKRASNFLLSHAGAKDLAFLLATRAEGTVATRHYTIAQDCAIKALLLSGGNFQLFSQRAPALSTLETLQSAAITDLGTAELYHRMAIVFTRCGNDPVAVTLGKLALEANERLQATVERKDECTMFIAQAYDRLNNRRAAATTLLNAAKQRPLDVSLACLLCHRLGNLDRASRDQGIHVLEKASFPGASPYMLAQFYWSLGCYFTDCPGSLSKAMLYREKAANLALTIPDKSLARALCTDFAGYAVQHGFVAQAEDMLNQVLPFVRDTDIDPIVNMVWVYRAAENVQAEKSCITRLNKVLTFSAGTKAQQYELCMRIANLNFQSEPDRALSLYLKAQTLAGGDAMKISQTFQPIVAYSSYHGSESKYWQQLAVRAREFFLSHSGLPPTLERFDALRSLTQFELSRGNKVVAKKLDTLCQTLATPPPGADEKTIRYCCYIRAFRALQRGSYAEAYSCLSQMHLKEKPHEEDANVIYLLQLMATTCSLQGRVQEHIYWRNRLREYLGVHPLSTEYDAIVTLADVYLTAGQPWKTAQLLNILKQTVVPKLTAKERSKQAIWLASRELELQKRNQGSTPEIDLSPLIKDAPMDRLHLMLRRADFMWCQGNYNSAAKHYAEVLNQIRLAKRHFSPDDIQAGCLLGLGLSNWAIGNVQAARQHISDWRNQYSTQVPPNFNFGFSFRYFAELFLALEDGCDDSRVSTVLVDWRHQVVAVPVFHQATTRHFFSLAAKSAREHKKPQLVKRIESLAQYFQCPVEVSPKTKLPQTTPEKTSKPDPNSK